MKWYGYVERRKKDEIVKKVKVIGGEGIWERSRAGKKWVVIIWGGGI